MRYIRFLILLLFAAAALPAAEPAIAVYYVPSEDLHRAPGYSDHGAMLPYDELIALVDKAKQADASAHAATQLTVNSLALDGSYAAQLRLQGTMKFQCNGPEWSAAAIDDGHIAWESQSLQDANGTDAFLAQVEGKTWLFAHGKGTAAIKLSAILAGNAEQNLGKVYVPAIAIIKLPKDSTIEVGGVHSLARTENEIVATIWPSADRDTIVSVTPAAKLAASSESEIELHRIANGRSGAILLTDEITIRNAANGAVYTLGMPKSGTFLRDEYLENCKGSIADTTVTLTALEAGSLKARFTFLLPMDAQDHATMAPW
ncbi:MAG: hypothetical protein ABI579_03585, partial [Candidatus Sumerlaeota bacterium]